jgi:hypothetical protein
MGMDHLEKAAAQLRAQLEERNRLQGMLKDLPDEFQQRYRDWCLAECQAEYARGFSLLRLIRSDAVARYLEFIRSLQSEEQRLQFVKILCRRWNSADLNSEEQRIIDQYAEFGTEPFVHSSGQILSTPRIPAEQAGLKKRFAAQGVDKRSLQQSLHRNHQAEEGPLGRLILNKTSALWFEKQVGIGYVVTAVEFAGWHQLRYVHTIYAAPGGRPGTNISKGISILTWLGIGRSAWSWLTPEDVPATVQGILKLSEHFFQAAEKLLAGLHVPQDAGL